jgi:hypothetical protein
MFVHVIAGWNGLNSGEVHPLTLSRTLPKNVQKSVQAMGDYCRCENGNNSISVDQGMKKSNGLL